MISNFLYNTDFNYSTILLILLVIFTVVTTITYLNGIFFYKNRNLYQNYILGVYDDDAYSECFYTTTINKLTKTRATIKKMKYRTLILYVLFYMLISILFIFTSTYSHMSKTDYTKINYNTEKTSTINLLQSNNFTNKKTKSELTYLGTINKYKYVFESEGTKFYVYKANLKTNNSSKNILEYNLYTAKDSKQLKNLNFKEFKSITISKDLLVKDYTGSAKKLKEINYYFYNKE